MTDGTNKEDGTKTPEPKAGDTKIEVDVSFLEEMKTGFSDLKTRFDKQEENLAWIKRDNEKLKEKAKERDAELKKKADSGDDEAKTKLAEEERRDLDEKYISEKERADKFATKFKQSAVVNPILDKVSGKFSDTPFAKQILRDAIAKFVEIEGDNDSPTGKMTNGKGQEFTDIEEFTSFLQKEMPDIALSKRASGVNEAGENFSANTAKGSAVVAASEYVKMSREDQQKVLKELEPAETAKLYNEIKRRGLA